MDYILENPLNQTVSIFTPTIVDELTNEVEYVKTELKAFVFADTKRIVDGTSIFYDDRTCFLSKTKPDRNAKVLPEATAETDVDMVDAQIIASIVPLINHNGEVEGYEVVL